MCTLRQRKLSNRFELSSLRAEFFPVDLWSKQEKKIIRNLKYGLRNEVNNILLYCISAGKETS